ncbi:hypothetical protein BS333_20020 [Vibrio azureus]|uniref:AB hydrolase-1 domain-containing protein n=1 Tax=Vibrio azureus NBRC 104587 TaxID=1219077 RepID=U3ARY1_9VIBR|nr:hypothetical protein [Vibrio azureus]AUI88593.1 hypothetical protein BS333_20020 [Vibrio azureus]GAD76012.1 hypothetical protein VAZ01S_035_00190 [Vibrio azureus NBRC 104587]
MKNKVHALTTLLLTMFFSSLANAALGDYKVILIHGFQAGQLQTKPTKTEVEADGDIYWQDYWSQYADARIDWPSHERVEGRISSDYVWPKLQELSQNGTCDTGCILVTHSTGDLVARYLLDNQENWLENAGLPPLNIVASLDFAGAGGGSELADLAINFTDGNDWYDSAVSYAISLWLGESPTKENTGVLNDLRVANARQISMLPDNRVPRIRFVGNGSDYLKATSSFLPGNDDGVVAVHSSCGSASSGDFESCFYNLSMNGKVKEQAKAVTRFLPNHYPLIMGDGYSHGETVGAKHQGHITSGTPSVSFSDGKEIKVETYQESGWFGSHYIYVQDSEQKTMSEVASQL